jgi:hypothetical protein
VVVHQQPTARRRLRVPALLASLASFLLLAGPGAASASAGDLIQLNGDPTVVLNGPYAFGHVFIDGVVKLAGDTTINASDVYIGPDAQFVPCFVQGVGDNACTDGRSLTIQASGPVSLATSLDLQGANVTPRAGGSLRVTGSSVRISGSVSTGGHMAGSGGVTVNATAGSLSMQAIYTSGGPISLHATGNVGVDGDLQAQPNGNAPNGPTQAASGGAVDVASSGGDVAIQGGVYTYGRDMTATGPLVGGNGGSVSISGGDVRVGHIDATPGNGYDLNAGTGGAVTVAARGALSLLGDLYADGAQSTSGVPSNGSAVKLSAGGALAAAGIDDRGANGPANGSAGGAVSVSGASISTGALYAYGGNANTTGAGGAGGSLTVHATGNAAVGVLDVGGGCGQSTGGNAGTIDLAGDRVSTGGIWADACNRGASGGSVRLWAGSGLSVGGDVRLSGAWGQGSSDPAQPGGNAGSLLARTATGVLDLGGSIFADGGGGAQGTAMGGAGGRGGSIDLVGNTIAGPLGISATGGYGNGVDSDHQANGGNGGVVRAWSDTQLFSGLIVIDTSAGNGKVNGVEGSQLLESAPSSLTVDPTTGQLTFTQNSPDAQGFRVFASVKGGPATQVLQSGPAAGTTVTLKPPAQVMCVPVSFTVEAFHDPLGWGSSMPPAVSWTRPPSAHQKCTDAPQITAAAKGWKHRKTLAKRSWKVRLRVALDGAGTLAGSLWDGHRKLVSASMPAPHAGRYTLVFQIPAKGRHLGFFTVKLRAAAPVGKAQSRATYKLEVRR